MRKVGQEAESIAASYLSRLGYKILEKNISYKFGELDIIASDENILVFVEVKHRKNNNFGDPFEAVTKSKQHKIILAAQAYLQKYKNIPTCRFDVISLVGDLRSPLIEHICDAFGIEY